MEVEVDLLKGSIRYRTDLEELVRICQILRKYLRKKHRRELKNLLEEVDKVYEIITKATNEFINIPYDDPDFTKSFASKRKVFEDQYKMDKESVGYRCDNVKQILSDLTKPNRSGSFIQRMQGKSEKDYLKSLAELKDHVDKWYAVDKWVYNDLQHLQHTLLKGLDEINETLTKKGSNEAHKEIQEFILKTRSEFDEFKKLNAKLKDLTSKL